MSTDPQQEFAERAFAAFAAAVRRPFGDAEALIELSRIFARYEDLQAAVGEIAADPAAVRLLIERPALGIGPAELAACGPGTLGAALRARHADFPFLPFEFGGSPVQTYLVSHLLATAPLWNAVLDSDPRDDTRLLLAAFMAAQLPLPALLALVAKNLSKVGLERFDRHDAAMAALVQGWTLGRRTRPLLAADWQSLLFRPLDEVRAGFGIDAADAAANRECSAALAVCAPVLAEGVDSEAFLGAMGRIVLLPYGTTGFDTGDALRAALVTPARVGELAKSLFADEELAARASGRPRMGQVDFRALHALPEGTLGRRYGDHMAVKEFDPPPAVPEGESDFARYFTAHIIECHDVWHVVTGADTDKAGECALHSFYAGQLRPLPVQLAYVARCILKTAIWDMAHARRHLDAVARGWLLARRARPLALVDWRGLFRTPLAEVRKRFQIPPEGIDAVQIETAPRAPARRAA